MNFRHRQRQQTATPSPISELAAVRARFDGARPAADQLDWARTLRTMERGGARLSAFQRQAWRAALAQAAAGCGVADQQASERRSARQADDGSEQA
ncbi:hypothetical protein [Piscinibacter gummiphilus]|uniref:Uncharacterized protein n=1 Tax=Piscinibacter gummiphilus TaxID=946333 RepID=A0ABZ0D1X4_9BURK|nr:hypothetical protein [Piscinibacter gummiphilus]WOB10761.1 hypothetical protein RXV79_12055 [Piscinibacter gummiphilus]